MGTRSRLWRRVFSRHQVAHGSSQHALQRRPYDPVRLFHRRSHAERSHWRTTIIVRSGHRPLSQARAQ